MLKQYEVKSYPESGRVYVLVTLDDGSTFGQSIDAGTDEEMDLLVEQAVARVTAPAVIRKTLPPIGLLRTMQTAKA